MAVNYLYAGSWLDDSGKTGGGIRLYRIQENGTLIQKEYVAGHIAAGYLALSADKKFLYAVNELKRRPNMTETEGSIYAYAVDTQNGLLKELNNVSSCGVFPNYLAVSLDGEYLYAVNYGSEDIIVRSRKNEQGNYVLERIYDESGMTAMRICKDGSLKPVEAMHIFKGRPSMYYPWFQASPHPHCICLSPEGEMLLVADRGCDAIWTCSYDRDKKDFNNFHKYKTAQGIGPRNCVYHPTLPYLYVVGEVKPYITAYRYEPKKAELREVETCLTADTALEYTQKEDFFACAHPSDIKIHPNGNMLYVANRGPDTISCFRISQKNGSLTHIKDVSSEGSWPWSLELTGDGKYMYVGNKMSGSISGFTVDEEGVPHYSNRMYEAERVVCLRCLTV